MDTYKIKGEDHYQCREVKAERDALRNQIGLMLEENNILIAERDVRRAELTRYERERYVADEMLLNQANTIKSMQDRIKNLETLLGENERLRAERDALKEQVEAMVPICSECYALRADAKRMRSALKVISTWASYDLEHCEGIAVALDAEHTLALAKKALNVEMEDAV